MKKLVEIGLIRMILIHLYYKWMAQQKSCLTYNFKHLPFSCKLTASRLSWKILGSLFVRIFVFLILVLFILSLLLLKNVLNVCFKDIIHYRRSLTLSLNLFNNSIVKQIHSLFPYRHFENRSLEWLAVMLFHNRLLTMRDLLQLTTLIPLIFVPIMTHGKLL